ncbi:hypothetical protein SH661x_001588 [Planctomicrobium sp. SH661]|uniref:hypothetical protein n=1 Tax=Planctomicrobium sp. SH661 TaxID=3448124 RepID=UPI003F5B375C
MKRLIMLSTILATLVVVNSPIQAAGRQPTSVNKPQRTGVFARMMELERRKNAAIRRALGWE